PWLDAGIVAMSTLQYNRDREYWQRWYPADLISESFPGQLRNWFYSLLAMSTILERKAPFKHCFTYSTLLAEDGRAMHKSWGNMIEFNEAADKMGVDVMRYLYCDHKPEKDLLFGYHNADEVRRQVVLPIWNVYSFFVTYANIDGWQPVGGLNAEYSELDRWILARMQEVVEQVTDRLERYQPDLATNAINQLVDDLSNWYLRRSRRRFWAKAGASKESDADKEAAYQTLYSVLTTLTRLLAPFMPFMTEEIYQNLVRSGDADAHESVHHTEWPTVDEELVDHQLTEEMGLVMRLVSQGHAARNSANVKLRQPLAEASFAVRSAREQSIVERYADLIAEELNVKQVRLLDTASEVVEYQLHPLPKQLGQKYGADFPPIRKAILAKEPGEAAERILAGERLEVTVEDRTIEVLPDEIEIRLEPREGFSAVGESGYVAALDTEVTDDLLKEGLAREVVRRVQDLRKEADYEVEDRIRLELRASGKLKEALESHKDYVRQETLAGAWEMTGEPKGEVRQSYQVEGDELAVAITRLPG
ncbi:MAG: DUF5915 domain-containing protein, partial [Anaerolineales bacterium]